MGWTYCCTRCKTMLNPDRSIIMLAAPKEGKRILVGFHPEPGNYEVYFPPGTSFDEGTRWDFFCPACQSSLTARGNEDMCVLELVEGDERQQVFFSRIAGEKMTFVHTREGIEVF